MVKVLYMIKIWLFGDQFKMTASENREICDLVTYTVLIHLRAWIIASIGDEAPLNDFRLMIELLRYPHKAISSATSKKLGLHLWYISEYLTLFDSRVSDEMRLMLAATAPDHPPKRQKVKSTAFLGTGGLDQLCTVNTKRSVACPSPDFSCG
jgi:hypothetical protein